MTTTIKEEEKEKQAAPEIPVATPPAARSIDWPLALWVLVVLVGFAFIGIEIHDALRDTKAACVKATAATQPVLSSTGGVLSTVSTTSTQKFAYHDRSNDVSYHLHLWSTSDGAQRGELAKRNADGSPRWTAPLGGIDAKGMHFETPWQRGCGCPGDRLAVVAQYVCGSSGADDKLHVDWNTATCRGVARIETPDACPGGPENPAATLRRLMDGRGLALVRGQHKYQLTLPSATSVGRLTQNGISCGYFLPAAESRRRLEMYQGGSSEHCGTPRSTGVTLLCGDKYEFVDVHETEPCRYEAYVTSPHVCGVETPK